MQKAVQIKTSHIFTAKAQIYDFSSFKVQTHLTMWLNEIFIMFYSSTIIFSAPINAQCGTSSFPQAQDARTRIVNGINAVPHSWPWTVLIQYNDAGNAFSCGGTLLGSADSVTASDKVVTAAHCLFDRNNKPLPFKGFTVILGIHNKRTQELSRVQVGVSNFLYHLEYSTANNDIALLQLSTPVKFNSYIKPICLSSQNQVPYDQTVCYAAGWGRMYNNNSNTPDLLQQARLPILPDGTCTRSYNNFNSNRMHCAGYMDGSKNICHGDSGTPLVCKEKDGRWTLYGIASYANENICAIANRPGIFTRVNKYRIWIEGAMRCLKDKKMC